MSVPSGVCWTSGWNCRPNRSAPVADGGHRGVLGKRQAGESRRQFLHPVAVAHPDLHRRRELVEQRRASAGQSPPRRRAVLVQRRVAELLLQPPRHCTAQLVHQRLHPVADTQDGQLALKHPVGNPGGVVLVNAGRPPRQDDPLRVDPLHLLPRVGGVGDFRVDLQLPHPAGDQVAVLGAEVDDSNTLVDLPGGPWGLRLDTLRDLQIGRDLQVIACGNSTPQWQLGSSRSGPPWRVEYGLAMQASHPFYTALISL